MSFVNNTTSTVKRGFGHVGLAHRLVFGSANMTPAMRSLRTLYIIIFAFLVWNGSPFHIVGAFRWTMVNWIAPLLHWPAGSAWWASAEPRLTGVNGEIAFGGLVLLMVVLHLLLRKARWIGTLVKTVVALVLWAAIVGIATGFPFGGLSELAAADNIPFAILGLIWLFVLSYVIADVIRLWNLAMKDLDSDMGQIIFRTVTRPILLEVIIILLVVWAFSQSGRVLSSNLIYQMVANAWQLPLGYFIGVGLNWLIEQRERSGLMPTKEQRNEHATTGPDGTPIAPDLVMHHTGDPLVPHDTGHHG